MAARMFAQNDQSDLLLASNNAHTLMGAWEEILSLRIALQKPLDVANKLPAHDDLEGVVQRTAEQSKDAEVVETFKANQKKVLKGLEAAANSLLDVLRPRENGASSSSAKGSKGDAVPASQLWDEISSVQEDMQKSWEATMEKWTARLHFGSEKARAQLKVFSQSAWGQIEGVLTDERRVMERSRMPADESERIGAKAELEEIEKRLESASKKKSSSKYGAPPSDESEEEDEDEERTSLAAADIYGLVDGIYVRPKGLGDDQDEKYGRKRKLYDAEVYDDRQLYSLLLKTFITSHSGAAVDGMRADDLAALRTYKRKKVNVDRKASKGRKIRYTVHTKLQNFMFPIPTASEHVFNHERLYTSLFQ